MKKKAIFLLLLLLVVQFSYVEVTKAGCGWQEMNMKWENPQELPGEMRTLVIDPKNPNIIYIGAWNGVFKS
ncbi:MAG: hypothetical protein ACP5JS_08880, partial [Fervidobacterium sp.]